MAAHSIFDTVQIARTRFERAGIAKDEAALDADVLARHALGGWDRGRMLASWRDPAPPGFETALEPLIARREHREPTAYITGHREFWGLEFEVGPGVLVPRPETELIVEAVLEHDTAVGPLRIADVGTGSGCLAVALAVSLPAALSRENGAGSSATSRENGAGPFSMSVLATDVSEAALAVARRNAARHGVDGRVTFARCDLFGDHAGPFDVIASNPPYIPAGDLAGLQPEIRLYEPEGALTAGADGLDVIRRLVPEAAARLAPGGLLAFEFGYGQADAVTRVVATEQRLDLIALRQDLAGIPRIAIARRTQG